MASQSWCNKLQLWLPELIQIDPGETQSYDYCYIYRFFAYSKKYSSPFKYIIRAEAHKDCFAIKFYCCRHKHSDHKYSLNLNAFNVRETFKLFFCVASVIPALLIKHPGYSFCFIGSRTYERSGKVEARENNQRYRVYKEISRNLFGNNTLEFRASEKLSAGFFINKLTNEDISHAERRIVEYMYTLYNFEI